MINIISGDKTINLIYQKNYINNNNILLKIKNTQKKLKVIENSCIIF